MDKMIDFTSRNLPTKFRYTHRSKIIFLFPLLSLFFLGCQEDNESPKLPDLNTYLQRFEEEASMRGYDFDLSVVEAVYVDEIKIGDYTGCGHGYTNYDGHGLRRIEISLAPSCGWEKLSDIERENLFFRVLGHAFFNRYNEDSWLCDGSPLSLMSFPTNHYEVYTETEEEKRAYYISELIDRTAVQDQCIDYSRSWSNDSVFYQYTQEDTDWWFVNDNVFPGINNPADALSIEITPGNKTEHSTNLYKRFDHPNIPECAEVTLRVTMNSEQLTGSGAAISIRAFHSPVGKVGAQTEEYMFLTTTENPVAGPLNNYVEELTIPCFSRNTTYMVIFLRLMPGTEGKITFDDVQLVVKEI